MAQVGITVNGRRYRLGCGEGEEARLQLLAGTLDRHIVALSDDFGQLGDERLLMMAGLMIADELLDAEVQITGLKEQLIAAGLEPVALGPAKHDLSESDHDADIGGDGGSQDKELSQAPGRGKAGDDGVSAGGQETSREAASPREPLSLQAPKPGTPKPEETSGQISDEAVIDLASIKTRSAPSG